MFRRLFLSVFSVFLLYSSPACAGEVPVPGRVTMVDIGAGTCIPCKMMAPVIEKVKGLYEGRAEIVFIDMRKDREAPEKFGISAIPTQIFHDGSGRERSRHVGFLDEAGIRKILDTLLSEADGASAR